MYRSLGLPVHAPVGARERETSRRRRRRPRRDDCGGRDSVISARWAAHRRARALPALCGSTHAERYEGPASEAVLRRYFEAGLLTAFAYRRLLDTTQIRARLFQPRHLHSARRHRRGACASVGVRVANWNPAYRKQTFIFSHGDTYHHTLMDEPDTEWERPAVDRRARSGADGLPAQPVAGDSGLDHLQRQSRGEPRRDCARASDIDFRSRPSAC